MDRAQELQIEVCLCCAVNKSEGVIGKMRRLQQLLFPAGAGINLCTGSLRGLGKLIEEVAVGNVVQ